MATKKKVATRDAGKTAGAKKVTAKKTAGPVAAKTLLKGAAGKTVKPAGKSIAAKPEKKKIMSSPSSDKPVKPKAVKTVPAKKPAPTNGVPKIDEPVPVKNQALNGDVPSSVPEVPVVKAAVPAKPAKQPVPDMRTKTARKYEPDFTKSVLDTPVQDQNGPSQRYSDADLQEFRELINKKLDAAKKELNYLQGLITRKDEMGGDESDNRYMTMEDGSISMEREQLSQMASRQITFIDHLEKALMRIENKTYGICRVTGKLIDKARLRAVPHATLSIEAKHMQHR